MFPLDLKLADVTPVYKNKSKNSKDNYRPVSILSIYEHILSTYLKFRFLSILFCPNISADFEETTMHNTA